ncbi:MAG: methionyl-tRNA formyltransferase [Gemmatimonadaceae bacterium]
MLFWGTSAFAVPALQALLGESFDVVGVVTQPDRPTGRSRSIVTPSPVKQCAVVEGVPVLQPERPRGDDFLESLRALAPELSVVVSYGHILPEPAIDLPAMGTINVHASLLPLLRGAAPIQAAIRDGLVETGVSIMRMVPALDAGPVILQAKTPVADDETYGELELRLSELGALALIETLTLMQMGRASEEPQNEAQATYARKIEREDARVRWHANAAAVARQIRAYDPKPGAFTTLGATAIKLYGASITDVPGGWEDATEGEVLALDEHGLLVACHDGALRISELKPSGKKRLTAAELARGRGIAVGAKLG